jgi:hypothetical protein
MFEFVTQSRVRTFKARRSWRAFILHRALTPPPLARCVSGLSDLAGRIILAPMSALLSPVQEDDIWRVKIVWPNRAVHHFGKFTSKKDATDWINAHPNLTKPEDTIDSRKSTFV